MMQKASDMRSCGASGHGFAPLDRDIRDNLVNVNREEYAGNVGEDHRIIVMRCLPVGKKSKSDTLQHITNNLNGNSLLCAEVNNINKFSILFLTLPTLRKND